MSVTATSIVCGYPLISFSSTLTTSHWSNPRSVDDCWSMKDGRVDGHIAVNKTRFPDGIDGPAKKIHDMDLKIGIYSCKDWLY